MNKVVFLDRDGTINIDKHFLYRKEDFEYKDGVIDGLRHLQHMGYLLIVVTNQSGIARGYYTEEDFISLTDWMTDDLAAQGIDICDVYYCPHHPDARIDKYRCICDCRKPKTGMFWKAVKDHNIDLSMSFLIGDKERDLSLVDESEAKGILISETAGGLCNDRIHICRSFTEAVEYIGDKK